MDNTTQSVDSSASTQELVPVLAGDGLTVRLVGVGGVGGIVARYVSIFLASLPCETRLVLIDGDTFEPKNANRMLFSNYGNKATVVRAELLHHFRDTRLTLIAIDQTVSRETISALLPGGEREIVLVCVDNHQARRLVSDYCGGRGEFAGVDDICVISGGNDGVGKDSGGVVRRGSYGNVQVYIRRDGSDVSPPLTAFHDEIAYADSQPDNTPHCTEVLDSVPQFLFTNLMTASAICNAFWLYLCQAIHYSEVGFDIVDGRMRPLGIPAPVL